jgi:hypothetical protein
MIYHTISPINVALCCGPSGHERRARCCIEVWGGWLFLRLIWSHPFLWFRTFWLFLYRMNASIFWARIVWTHVKRHVQPSIFWGPQLWTPCCGQQWNLNQTIVMEPWRGCDFFVGKGWDTVQDGINMWRWNWGQLMVQKSKECGYPICAESGWSVPT